MANMRKITSSHGIGPVTQKWLTGARLHFRLLKRLEDSVAMRESAFVEREYRGAQRFRNVFLPALMDLQKRDKAAAPSSITGTSITRQE
jgi:hypothetical protein